MALDRRADPGAVDGDKVARGGKCDSLLQRGLQDGVGDGVFRVHLHGRGP